MNKVLLRIELQYFPPVVCYSALICHEHVDYILYESYRKASFRNRCLIAGPNGLVSLSVPIAGGRGVKVSYGEVGIDNGIPWQRRHFQAIRSSYGKSPFFEHLEGGLAELYGRRLERLADWNLACLDWVDRVLGTVSARQVADTGGMNAAYVDWKDRVLPANHRDPGLGPFPVYPQVFQEKSGFQPNLSVLDLVMSMGRASVGMLQGGVEDRR